MVFACGRPPQKLQKRDIGHEVEVIREEMEPVIPESAVTADFGGGPDVFYAYIKRIDPENAVTYIGFEKDRFPEVKIPKTYGAVLSSLHFEGYDGDLLLVTAKLKDTNFNKYFLYILRDSLWKPMTNGFAIHKSHLSDTLVPISPNPNKPNELLRYYSVFDLDNSNGAGYTWRLLRESVPIE